MATLQELHAEGYRITLYCTSTVGLCSHSWVPSWDQLIQYLGAEFDLAGDRALMGRFRCERCGSRGATVIVLPAHDPRTQGVGGWINHGQPSAAEREALHREGERARIAMSAQVQASIDRRQRVIVERKARKAVESGRDPIGPPDPRAWRKRRF